ncbi:hypothetical protein F5Y14DRAFT_448755 [Nemania sp. NC0429]|nr:hypothetical protein F5Y14DRAFT_448755 [Nemania sp. NC0429]
MSSYAWVAAGRGIFVSAPSIPFKARPRMPSSKKRKSRDNEDVELATAIATPTDLTAGTTDVSSKKRRRVSEGEDVSKPEKRKSRSAKRNKLKKEKKGAGNLEDGEEGVNGEVEGETQGEGSPGVTKATKSTDPKASASKKDGKGKKGEKKSSAKAKTTTTKSKSDLTADTPADADADAKSGAEEEVEAEGEADAEADAKKRFIVFVGNLPYSATQAQITAHFASVHPTSVRLLHRRDDPSRSRGVAFVEFARYDHMKTALKLFHHSTFRCPASSSSFSNTNGRTNNRARNARENKSTHQGGEDGPFEERKINVELTAGGGGNTEYRRERIRAKNEKLNDERARRAREEARLRDKKGRQGEEGKQDEEKKKQTQEDEAVHPSRRRRVPRSAAA